MVMVAANGDVVRYKMLLNIPFVDMKEFFEFNLPIEVIRQVVMGFVKRKTDKEKYCEACRYFKLDKDCVNCEYWEK